MRTRLVTVLPSAQTSVRLRKSAVPMTSSRSKVDVAAKAVPGTARTAKVAPRATRRGTDMGGSLLRGRFPRTGAERPDVVEEPVRSQHVQRRGEERDEGEEGDHERHDTVHAAGLDARCDS